MCDMVTLIDIDRQYHRETCLVPVSLRPSSNAICTSLVIRLWLSHHAQNVTILFENNSTALAENWGYPQCSEDSKYSTRWSMAVSFRVGCQFCSKHDQTINHGRKE